MPNHPIERLTEIAPLTWLRFFKFAKKHTPPLATPHYASRHRPVPRPAFEKISAFDPAPPAY